MFLVQLQFPQTLIFSNSIPSINIIFIYKLYLLLGIKNCIKNVCLTNSSILFIHFIQTFCINLALKIVCIWFLQKFSVLL